MPSLFRRVYLIVFLTAVSSCSQTKSDIQFLQSVPEYTSQVQIFSQEFVSISSPYGALSSVVFAYDRDRNDKTVLQSGRRGIDLVEVKLFNRTGHWNWYPFLVLSDDTYDGYVDRLFIDENLDGRLDEVSDIRRQGMLIEQIRFNEFRPWQVIKKQNRRDASDTFTYILRPRP